MQKKTRNIVVAVVLLMFIVGANNSNRQKSQSKQSSSKSSSVVVSSSAKSTSTASSSSTDKYKPVITELNNWYDQTMKQQMANDYNASSTPSNTSLYKKSLILKGFKNNNDQILAIVDKNRMDSENYSQKEMAQFAFNAVTAQYDKSDDLKIFSNYKNGYIEKPSISDIGMYVEFE